jgi:hypothetical protein
VQRATDGDLVHTPSNEGTRLLQALVSRLKPSNDLRYWLVWLYGPFLTEIPRRLGKNQALDDAALATLAIHNEACLRTAQADNPGPALSTYYRALSSLRGILSDPVEALSSETLTAVMLLVSAHARVDGPFASFCSPHGKGMLQLLRLRQHHQSFQHLGHRVHQFERYYQIERYYFGRRDEFDDVLMSMLQMSVLLQSFANSEVVLTPNEYQSLRSGITGETYTARGLRSLIALSELYFDARSAMEENDLLEPLIDRVEDLHNTVEVIVVEHFERLGNFGAELHHPDTAVRLYGIYSRAYGMAISTSGLTTCLRRALRPYDQQVQVDASRSVQQVIDSRAIADIFLPLGASWLGWALMIAWCAARGLPERLSCEAALEDYLRISQGPTAVLRMDLLRVLEQRLWLGRLDRI